MSEDKFDKNIRWNECPLDRRIEAYSLFLSPGDFEKYQPAVYMDKATDEYFNLKYDAIASFVAGSWKINRFTEFMSKEWWKYAKLGQAHFKILELMSLDERIRRKYFD